MTSSTTVDPRLVRKVAFRLLPMLMVLYFFNYLDKVNVGFASLTMDANLGLSETAYGLGAGLFFVGYFLFEVPSNIFLAKVGARVWITRIVVTWGIIEAAMCLIQGPVTFYIVRFLLGVAEAGFFPGIVFYLGLWFPRVERARIVAIIYAMVPVSTMLGSPLAALLMQHNPMFSEGWRFMYLACGAASVIFGIIGFFVLSDRPTKARWLARDDAERLEAALLAEDSEVESGHGQRSIRDAFSGRVLLLAVIYFGVAYGLYALGFFLPQVVSDFQKEYGLHLSLLQIALITAIPYAVAVIAMILWGRHADRSREHYIHAAIPTIIGGITIALSLVAGSPYLTMVGITITAVGIYCCIPVFWQLPPAFLTGTVAAAGIGVVNSIGNLSGFVAPYVTGYFQDLTGSFQPGMLIAAGFMVLSGVLVLVARTRAGREPVVTALAEELPNAAP
jgi:MFS family permease